MILLWIVGLLILPAFIAWEWICLSWCMDLQLSRRRNICVFSLERMWVVGWQN
uniref:Uncharacterized protein n=1 Tax=Rhizophora mucronata TaxID=61149 RepID=A0A2P2IRD6_RHIMU